MATIIDVCDECGREAGGDTCDAHPSAVVHSVMRRRMARVSLDNGCSIRAVADLTDTELALAIRHVESGDDDLREAVHVQGHDSDRAYLAAYCDEHERRYGSVWSLP